MGGLASFMFKINPINFSCYSASFSHRITKYRKKGFRPIFVNKIFENKDLRTYGKFFSLNVESDKNTSNDYSVKLSSHKLINLKEKIKRLNFSCLMRGDLEGFCIANGEIISKEEFIKMAENLKEIEKNILNSGYRSRRNFGTRIHLFPKTEYASSFYNLHCYDKSDLFFEFLFKLRVSNIEKYYHDYTSVVGSFRISNPTTQHTSSFHPLVFKTLEEHKDFKQKIFGIKYISHDLSTPGKAPIFSKK